MIRAAAAFGWNSRSRKRFSLREPQRASRAFGLPMPPSISSGRPRLASPTGDLCARLAELFRRQVRDPRRSWSAGLIQTRRHVRPAAGRSDRQRAPDSAQFVIADEGRSMKKEMLVNALQPEESRIAIVENGVLEELYIERNSLENFVGNIYKGRVVNIEPSIQAAFVDFGVGRNGFLHVSDVEYQYYKHLTGPGGAALPRPDDDEDDEDERPQRGKKR